MEGGLGYEDERYILNAFFFVVIIHAELHWSPANDAGFAVD